MDTTAPHPDPFQAWHIGSGSKLMIAGPCSAESETQLLDTARALARCHIDVLRAGLWKPRTKPGTFAGVGDAGLPWLRRVQKETGLPVCVEVATPAHVQACLQHDIDMVWIGARTTVNPFSMQALADALRGVAIPVLVKNPINPELDLWLGAVERLCRAGLTKIAVVHRGFSAATETVYRNRPYWTIPIEMKLRHPEIPLICDPSHISGDRRLVFDIAQKAMDLLFDGLMIEAHITPASALSDARQQLDPAGLKQLLDKLEFKRAHSDDVEFTRTLEQLREKIDIADETIIAALARRMRIVDEIGRYKQQNNVAILQPERWKEIVTSRVSAGIRRNLSERFMRDLYRCIHAESILHQENQFKKDGK
jgi:chorismate mutase